MRTSHSKNHSTQKLLLARIVIFALISLLTSEKINAQDALHSQYYATPLLVAPSFAGNSLGSRAFLNFRDQWANLPGAFITYSAAIDNNFYNLNSGMGLMVQRDEAGSAKLGTTSVSAMYSYRFNVVDDWRIRPGIGFTFGQRSLNYNSAIFGDQISVTGVDNVTIEQRNAPYSYWDASASVVVYNRVLWLGLCADHLMKPNLSFGKNNAQLPLLWKQFGGINIPMRNRVGKATEIVTVNYLLLASKIYQQYEIGVNWYHAPLLLGFAWRGVPVLKDTYDSVILTVGLAFGNLAFGYSYDYTINQLSSPTGGSHEITISIGFNEGGKKMSKGAIPCPDVVKFRMFGDKESFR